MTAASTSWCSAEDIIQAICDFLLNDEYSAIKVILDCCILLLALRFKGGFQVSDFHFKGVNLNLPLGYPGSCPILLCIRRYVGRFTVQVVEVKRPHKRRTTRGGCLLPDNVRRVARFAGVSIRSVLSTGIGSGRYGQGVDPERTGLRVDNSGWTGIFGQATSLLGRVMDTDWLNGRSGLIGAAATNTVSPPREELSVRKQGHVGLVGIFGPFGWSKGVIERFIW